MLFGTLPPLMAELGFFTYHFGHQMHNDLLERIFLLGELLEPHELCACNNRDRIMGLRRGFQLRNLVSRHLINSGIQVTLALSFLDKQAAKESRYDKEAVMKFFHMVCTSPIRSMQLMFHWVQSSNVFGPFNS